MRQIATEQRDRQDGCTLSLHPLRNPRERLRRQWYGARHEAFTVAQTAQATRLSHEAARKLCAVDANVGKLRRLSEGVYARAV
jgi:hypothetical protein